MKIDREQLPYQVFFGAIGVGLILIFAGLLAQTMVATEGVAKSITFWCISVCIVMGLVTAKLHPDATAKNYFWVMVIVCAGTVTLGWLGLLFNTHFLVPLIK